MILWLYLIGSICFAVGTAMSMYAPKPVTEERVREIFCEQALRHRLITRCDAGPLAIRPEEK